MKKGSLVYLFDNTPAIVVKIVDNLWASECYYIPLADSFFSIKGEVESDLVENIKLQPFIL